MKRALLAVILAACSKVTYVDHTTVPTGIVASETGHFYLGGLVGHTTLPVYAMCPSGVSRIQSKFTFSDLLLAVLTLDIYTPRTYDVECGR
jgi:Bor protein